MTVEAEIDGVERGGVGMARTQEKLESGWHVKRAEGFPYFDILFW